MSAERIIASHLRLAAEALSAAETLAAIGNRNAAYQAQQAVEQIMLGLAQSEGLHIGRSQHHQLETVRRILPEADPYREHLRGLTWLEGFATAFRYPKTQGGLAAPPAAAKLGAAMTEIRALLKALAAHFSVDLSLESDHPAAHSRPPR